jgi:hypothetical protein
MSPHSRALLLMALVTSPAVVHAQAGSISLQAKAIATGGRVRTWGGGGTSYLQDAAFDRTLLTQDFWTNRQRDSKANSFHGAAPG